MANAVPTHQSPPQQPAAVLLIKHLATTTFLHSPSVSPPLPNISITLKSPLRYKKLSEALPHSLVELKASEAPPLADGLKFELHTLPVDAKEVADGDTVTVYVNTSNTRESSSVPQKVQIAAVERNQACAERNYNKANAMHKQITNADYKVLHIKNEDILARKYRIRLRGIDAPETSMPYGKEAKDELVKIIDGKCLKILIFGEDRYGRFVGDIYCNNIFVQEAMLKKGLAWHYTVYDKRTELEKWEKDARAKRIGLWASSDPEMPWKWRKNRREHR